MTPRVARLQWDDANLGHIALHFVTRDEVEQAFFDTFSTLEHFDEVTGEKRYRMLAKAPDGPVLAIVFVIRQQSIRTVTAYSAKGKLLAKYRREATR